MYYPKFYGIDTFVSTASTATLTYKTYSAPTIAKTFPGNTSIDGSGNATFSRNTYCDNSTNYMLTRAFKDSSTASAGVVTFSLQQSLGGNTFGVNGGTYLVTMSLQSSDFGLPRGFRSGIFNYSGFAGGKSQGYTISSNNSYEFTQMQICY